MANEHGPPAQLIAELAALKSRMVHEQEVRLRGKHLEPALCQRVRQPRTLPSYLRHALPQVVLVLHGRRSHRLGERTYAEGVEAEANVLHVADKLGRADSETDVGAGQVARLRKRLHDHHVRAFPHQGHAGFRTIVDIGLVHHHKAIRVGLGNSPHVVRAHRQTRRCIRVREHHSPLELTEALNIKREVVAQGHRRSRKAERCRIVAVKPIGDVGKAQRIPFFEGREEQEAKHFIAAVADKYRLLIDPQRTGHGCLKRPSVRVGIEAEALHQSVAQGLAHPRRRGHRRLVRVQLDETGPRLLARHIGRNPLVALCQISAHAIRLPQACA